MVGDRDSEKEKEGREGSEGGRRVERAGLKVKDGGMGKKVRSEKRNWKSRKRGL